MTEISDESTTSDLVDSRHLNPSSQTGLGGVAFGGLSWLMSLNINSIGVIGEK